MSYLDEKYLNFISSSLPLFKKKQMGLYNCRCIECGDSQKDKLKARGYFYTKNNKLKYKCHNCGSNKSFPKFLKDNFPSYFEEYRLESFRDKMRDKPAKKEIVIPKTKKKFKSAPKTLLDDFQKIVDLPDDHPAKKYLVEREIPLEFFDRLYYVDKIADVANKIDKYKDKKYDRVPRVIIPSYNEQGDLTFLGCRAVGESKLRYITLATTDDENEHKCYGLDRIDRNKTVYILEGQFDSMFIPNAIAMNGSDFDARFLGDNVVYVMDNEPRSKIITKKIEQLINKGYAVVIWGKIEGKDINKMIQNGMSKEQVFEHIKEHTYTGLRAKMALSEYRK